MTVFWAMLVERSVDGDVTQNAMDIAGVCAVVGYARIPQTYSRTDMARNYICKTFLKHATSEDDVVVMLDNDHMMPRDIVPRLAQQVDATHEVVGALAFRRSAPHDPCFFIRDEAGKNFDIVTKYNVGLLKCLCVGTGAIAIRRSVFTKLDAAGLHWPYFRYSYKEDAELQNTEDFEFGQSCDKVGVPHWVDTSFQIPHMGKKWIGMDDFYAVLQEAHDEPDQTNAKYARAGISFSRVDNGNGAGARHTEAGS